MKYGKVKQQVTIRVPISIIAEVRMIAAIDYKGVSGAAYEALIKEALEARERKEVGK